MLSFCGEQKVTAKFVLAKRDLRVYPETQTEV